MPKIIKECKSKILEAARVELLENQDGGFSMRRVSSRAKVAVGTIYHYYPDKIDLIAAILLESWEEKYASTDERMNQCESVFEVIHQILSLISSYRMENASTFKSYKGEGFSDYYVRLHSSFVGQIQALFVKGREHLQISLSEEEDRMISEMILIQSRTGEISESVPYP